MRAARTAPAGARRVPPTAEASARPSALLQPWLALSARPTDPGREPCLFSARRSADPNGSVLIRVVHVSAGHGHAERAQPTAGVRLAPREVVVVVHLVDTRARLRSAPGER